GFLLLEKFPFAAVSLVTAAIERNVAARNHHATLAARQSIMSQRGRRNCSAVHGPHAGIANRLHDRLSDFAASAHLRNESIGARTQVARKIEGISCADTAIGRMERLQILQFRMRVDVKFELGKIHHSAATAAGAEFQFSWIVFEGGPKRITWR